MPCRDTITPGADADNWLLKVFVFLFFCPVLQDKMILKHLWWIDWGVDQYGPVIAPLLAEKQHSPFPTCAMFRASLPAYFGFLICLLVSCSC